MDYLFKTTIGNKGALLHNCDSYEIESSNEVSLILTIKFDCADMVISSINSFSKYTSSKLNQYNGFNFTSINTDHDCNYKAEFQKTFEAQCVNMPKCNLSFDPAVITTECVLSQSEKFYLSYSCYESVLAISLLLEVFLAYVLLALIYFAAFHFCLLFLLLRYTSNMI